MKNQRKKECKKERMPDRLEETTKGGRGGRGGGKTASNAKKQTQPSSRTMTGGATKTTIWQAIGWPIRPGTTMGPSGLLSGGAAVWPSMSYNSHQQLSETVGRNTGHTDTAKTHDHAYIHDIIKYVEAANTAHPPKPCLA